MFSLETFQNIQIDFLSKFINQLNFSSLYLFFITQLLAEPSLDSLFLFFIYPRYLHSFGINPFFLVLCIPHSFFIFISNSFLNIDIFRNMTFLFLLPRVFMRQLFKSGRQKGFFENLFTCSSPNVLNFFKNDFIIFLSTFNLSIENFNSSLVVICEFS